MTFLEHRTQNWGVSGFVMDSLGRVNSTPTKGMHGSMKLHSHSSPATHGLSPEWGMGSLRKASS